MAVLEEQDQQLSAKLKAAGKLRVKLVDAVQEEHKSGARCLVACLIWRIA